MSDNESPLPFRRERNLSNRNFARKSSRRRFSTESHNSTGSHSNSTDVYFTANSNDQSKTTSNADLSSSSTTSSSGSSASLQLTSPSSSMHISYSVNSDTENAFNARSLLKMLPPVSSTESEESVDDSNNIASTAAVTDLNDSPEPALLGVKQKVKRFETLQAEERIIFKTGKYNTKHLHALIMNKNHRVHMGPQRVLPVLSKKLNVPDESSSSSFVQNASIDEERSEDEVEEISDFAEGENINTKPKLSSADYELPEEALEVTESSLPSPTISFSTTYDDSGVNLNATEYSMDDFGKIETVRRTISSDYNKLSLPSTPGTPYLETASLNIQLSNHSNEQDNETSTDVANKKTGKDFPRNFRSVPRPKTEFIGTTNHHIVAKYSSLTLQRKDKNHKAHDEAYDDEDGEIELRDKCDKFIHPILEELIKTEETYVENLFTGLENYGNIFNRKDLPIGLRGKKYVLLGNIEQIAEFHRDEFLPMLHRNKRDLKRLFDEFQMLIDENYFYGYVIFTMNKQRSLKLCDIYKNYFKLIQTELDDKLGINSFLVQPIQRMARYPLLLQQFITTLFKNRDYVMKPVIESCCRLEKKLRTLLTTTNESETINDIIDCNEFNVFYQGKFRKVSEFQVYDYTLKRSYRSLVFIFDKCIIYTEKRSKKELVFHGRYPCEHIGISAKTKSFTLFYERRKQQECDFSADPQLIETWLQLIREMIESYEKQKVAERYSRNSDSHLHRIPPSLSLFRDSNRFSSDSGIGNIWVMPKPENEEINNNRTTCISPTSTPNSTSSSNSFARLSQSFISNSFSNGCFPSHTLSIETLSDEYHEDEDTLSLENLFPCDQSEIYASKKISFIIDELIQTETNYTHNLRKGLKNYGNLKDREDLPESLQGDERQQQLLGNVAELLELHEQQILPMMLRNQRDLKALFDEFATYFDKNSFYCYVIFTMNKKTSMQLRQEHRQWFQTYQTEINDKLGVDSFLVQPIQRLTRYPLLLQQFISEFYKSGISCKPVLMSVCKLETRMRRLLEVVNQAEEITNIDEISEINLEEQGYFRRSTCFDAYHYRSRKKYRAKVFLFDGCLICTEVRRKRLAYRHHYQWHTLELKLNSSKSITMLVKHSTPTTPVAAAAALVNAVSHSVSNNDNTDSSSTNVQSKHVKEEYDFSAPEAISVTQWMKCARKILETARIEAAQKGKFSLPMDLVLGVVIAIWLIWQYL